MNYMVQNRDHFEEFVTEDFDEYVTSRHASLHPPHVLAFF
jgi:hypothetical protein